MKKRFCGLSLLWLLAVSCATVKEHPDLAVSLVNLRFQEATAFEMTLQASVRLQNVGLDPIKVEGVSYKIFLNGTPLGGGVSADRVTVPRFDSVLQTVTLHISSLALAARIRTLINEDIVDYRVLSEFSTRTSDPGGHEKRFNVTGEGWIDFRDFAAGTGARPRKKTE